MSNMVFISYAKEDLKYAEKLYEFLSENGFDIWMDKKQLLVGQEWDYHIRAALRKSDFIILLLSTTSVIKQGYVQREFKLALQYCEERPPGYIYIIPIKIDDCEVPETLSKFHWENYSDESTFNKILDSLNAQNGKTAKDNIKRMAISNNLEFEDIVIKDEIGNNPKFVVDIEYMQFKNNNIVSLNEINTIIKYQVISKLVNNRTFYLKSIETRNELNTKGNQESQYLMGLGTSWNVDLRYAIRLLKPTIFSVTIYQSSYSGGAHHGYATNGYNFILNPLVNMEIRDFFDDKKAALDFVKKIVNFKLTEPSSRENSSYHVIDYEMLQKIYKKDEWELFRNFYLTESSIVFVFNPYVLMLGFADQIVEVTFEEFLIALPNDRKLQRKFEFISK